MVTVVRMNKIENSKTKAFVDLDYYGLIIKGLRVVEGMNGPFVSYPDEKSKDGKYYETIIPATQTTKIEIENTILNYYKNNIK